MDKRKVIVAAAGIALGVLVPVVGIGCGLFDGLGTSGAMALGILAGSIVWWVGNVLPESATALIMVILFVVVCGVPTQSAFASFASSTWWLLVAAFSLGYGMHRTGLMGRMARSVLRLFPRTFKMQAAGLIAAGTIAGPFVPSLSVKASMMAPLAMSISDSMGYERQGRQANGLFLAMFTGIRNVGPFIISASVIGYCLVATLPADVAARYDIVHWALAMLPWFVFVSVANYALIVALYAPKGQKRRSHGKRGGHAGDADAAVATSSSVEKPAATDAPQPMGKAEKRLAVIMGCCIVLWVTEPLHGIESHMVALGALVAMVALGVVPMKEVCRNIAWDSLIFVGCVFGLADVFAYLGIDTWMVNACAPVFEVLFANPYLMVVGVCAITLAVRFVIVSQMAYINIFMAFLVPFSISCGVDPWVVGVCIYAVVDPWFVLYQNPVYLTAFYAVEGKMARQSEMARFCVPYSLICVAGLIVSVPVWQLMGIL